MALSRKRIKKRVPHNPPPIMAQAQIAERYVENVISEVRSAVEIGTVDIQTQRLIQALERIGRAASICVNNSGVTSDALEVITQAADGFARSTEYCKRAIVAKQKTKEVGLIFQRLIRASESAVAFIQWLEEAPEAAWLYEEDTRTPEAIIAAEGFTRSASGVVSETRQAFARRANPETQPQSNPERTLDEN